MDRELRRNPLKCKLSLILTTLMITRTHLTRIINPLLEQSRSPIYLKYHSYLILITFAPSVWTDPREYHIYHISARKVRSVNHLPYADLVLVLSAYTADFQDRQEMLLHTYNHYFMLYLMLMTSFIDRFILLSMKNHFFNGRPESSMKSAKHQLSYNIYVNGLEHIYLKNLHVQTVL